MKFNAALLEAAGRHLGTAEWAGAKTNPAVTAYFEAAGHAEIHDDETPWCAAFVGSVCAELGLPHTGKLNARSYLSWGAPVSMQDAQPGDVVVLWRGSPESAQGHVAFLVRFDGAKAILRGGNQGNKVSDEGYPVSRILGIRGAVSLQPGNNLPILQMGAKGMFVRDLQIKLVGLGYAVGAKDGDFGPRVRDAVLAFQAENGLVSDGVVGAKTWAAFATAKKRAARPVDRRVLMARGSRTVLQAEKVILGGVGTVGAVGAATIAQNIQETAVAIQQARDTFGVLGGVLGVNWPIAALAIGGWMVIRPALAIIRARVDDAVSGRNLGR